MPTTLWVGVVLISPATGSGATVDYVKQLDTSQVMAVI